MTRPNRIHWIRFSIRSALIGFLFCGAWLAVISINARKQDQAVKQIIDAGGTVLYYFNYGSLGETYPDAEPPCPKWLRGLVTEGYYADVLGVEFSGSSVKNSDLNCLSDLRSLDKLVLSGCTQISDEGLKVIGDSLNLRTLTILNLDNTNVSDSGLEHITNMQQLKGLYLDSSHITDSGLSHIAKLHSLEELAIERTNVSDYGLKVIGSSPNLQSLKMLSLNGTRITDKGLEYINSLKHLEGLYLADTELTNACLPHIARFQKLKYLGLERTQIGDKLFEEYPVKQLRSLRISGTRVSSKRASEVEGNNPSLMLSFDRAKQDAVMP